MKKFLTKLLKRLRKKDRVKAPSGLLVGMARSDLEFWERSDTLKPCYIPENTSVLRSTLPTTGEAVIPPPVPPVDDPPLELEAIPVTKAGQLVAPVASPPDEQKPKDASEQSRSESCWDKAATNIEKTRPDVYKQLEKIINSNHDPRELLKSAQPKIASKRIPRSIEQAIRSILQFKEVITAAANIDLHKILPVIWRGLCVVLEATCYPHRFQS
jgi:hypothetical protein